MSCTRNVGALSVFLDNHPLTRAALDPNVESFQKFSKLVYAGAFELVKQVCSV